MKETNYNEQHKREILEWLKSRKSINFLQARTELFCFDLQTRIHELEAEGYKIIRDCEILPNGDVQRCYRLDK